VKAVFTAFFFLLTISRLFAQDVATSGMPTLETAFFAKLEKQLGNAVVAHDRVALESLLANDFELRTARSDGEVTLRDDWLNAAISTYKIRSFEISRLTVRPIGNSAVINFFYQQHAALARQDVSGDFFLVDIWQKAGNDWKLVARYSAGPGVTSKPASNPKTKE